MFLLSSCSYVNDPNIQEENLDINHFFWELQNSGSTQNLVNNTWSTNDTNESSWNTYSDLENISLDRSNIIDGSDDEESLAEDTTEKDLKELIDILVE
jgi:hypothetical protein